MEPATVGAACIVVVGYLCIVRSLRWRRYTAMHAEYRSRFESNTLTPEDAQRIIHVGAYYDMPLLLNYSLAFALFKTYGIVCLLSYFLYLLHHSLLGSAPKALYFKDFGSHERVEFDGPYI